MQTITNIISDHYINKENIKSHKRHIDKIIIKYRPHYFIYCNKKN